MDNIENYLYLIFAVIYIVSRIIKARNKHKEADTQTQSHTPAVTTQAKPKKAFSFEDILKEFEKNLGGQEYEEESPAPAVEHRQEVRRPKPAPKVEKRPSIYETYEGMTYESMPVTANEEQESLFGGFKADESNQNVAGDFAKKLQDPNGFREAFIMSEIINRKY